jgi:hypothetical protein
VVAVVVVDTDFGRNATGVSVFISAQQNSQFALPVAPLQMV